MDNKLDAGNFCEKYNFLLLDVYIKYCNVNYTSDLWNRSNIGASEITKLQQAPQSVHETQIGKVTSDLSPHNTTITHDSD
jgi:hypothetical protein